MKNKKVDFEKLRSGFFFTLIIGLAIALGYIIRPFFYPLLWTVILAILFYPLYNKIEKHIKMPSASSIITIIIVLATIVIPLFVVLLLLINQSVDLYHLFSTGNLLQNFQGLTTWLQHSRLAPLVQSIESGWRQYATEATQQLGTFLFQILKSLTENSIRFIFMFFIMFYSLYYLLKDGQKILGKAMHLSPLGDEYEAVLYNRFTSTVRATIKGTFIIGGIQGIIGAILFTITGIPGALIWGIIMMMAALIPGLGAFIVWMPAALISLIIGNVWQGITILLVGLLLISTIDNLLRPPLVGKDTQLHPLLVLFSSLGGIVVFGLSGFVIGPVIAALFLSVISIYDDYYKSELKQN